MALIPFPGRADNLRQQIACASYSPQNWDRVAVAIDDLFPGVTTRIQRVSLLAAPDAAALPSDRPDPDAWLAQHVVGLPAGAVFDIRAPAGGASSPETRITGLLLHRCDTSCWVLAVARQADADVPSRAPVSALIHRHAEALQRAFLISHCLGTECAPDRAAIEESWDSLPFGVALLSRRRTILAANSAAEDLLSTRRFFLPPRDHSTVRPATAKDRRRLFRAVDRIILGECDGDDLLIEGLRHGEPMPVSLLAVGGDTCASLPPAPASNRRDSLIAVIGRPDQDAQTDG